jgi:hypothetical protein
VAAIDAFYAENPEKAHHRSPAHVCVTCRRHLTAPTWRLEHLHRYVAPPWPISSLVFIYPRKSYLVRALHLVVQLASTRRWCKGWASCGKATVCPVCPPLPLPLHSSFSLA